LDSLVAFEKANLLPTLELFMAHFAFDRIFLSVTSSRRSACAPLSLVSKRNKARSVPSGESTGPWANGFKINTLPSVITSKYPHFFGPENDIKRLIFTHRDQACVTV
jgi:hypothetical protein